MDDLVDFGPSFHSRFNCLPFMGGRMNSFILRLATILKAPRAPPILKPEAKECVRFANRCRELSLRGDLKAVWFSVTNEYSGKTNKLFGCLMWAMGRIPGCPDYIFLWKRGCGCIEMKSAKGVLQPNQKVFKEWCETMDVPYVVCRSAEEALLILAKWEVL